MFTFWQEVPLQPRYQFDSFDQFEQYYACFTFWQGYPCDDVTFEGRELLILFPATFFAEFNCAEV